MKGKRARSASSRDVVAGARRPRRRRPGSAARRRRRAAGSTAAARAAARAISSRRRGLDRVEGGAVGGEVLQHGGLRAGQGRGGERRGCGRGTRATTSSPRRDRDVVQAAAAAQHPLDRGGDELLALAHGGEEGDVGAGRDGVRAAGVAGEREGGVGEQEQVAAVAGAVAVEHRGGDGHRGGRAAGADVVERRCRAPGWRCRPPTCGPPARGPARRRPRATHLLVPTVRSVDRIVGQVGPHGKDLDGQVCSHAAPAPSRRSGPAP